MKVRYQLKDPYAKSGWVTLTKAVPVKNGWLHWEKREGGTLSTGLAKPGNWRIKP